MTGTAIGGERAAQLAEFDQTLAAMMDGVFPIRPVTVEVPGVGPAWVAIKAHVDRPFSQRHIFGIASYVAEPRVVVGEEHIESMELPEHHVHRHTYCCGVRGEGEEFAPYRMQRGASLDTKHRPNRDELWLGLRIVQALSNPGYARCVFSDVEGLAQRSARFIRGVGAHALFHDPALNLALAKVLS